MPIREWFKRLYELAEDQHGYLTAAQARDAGVLQVRLLQLLEQGEVERVSRGVYRLTHFPESPFGQYMQAALWPQVRRAGVRGVVSHESALTLYDLSDASPSRVHITVPPSVRIRRETPEYLVVHHASLDPADVTTHEHIPVTTVERTIRDVAAAHIGPALVRQAIEDAGRIGLITNRQAERLTRQLLTASPGHQQA